MYKRQVLLFSFFHCKYHHGPCLPSGTFPGKPGNASTPDLFSQAGYWKATGPNKFKGGGTRSSDFSKGCSKGNMSKYSRTYFSKRMKQSFGKSLRQIRRSCTPTSRCIGPVGLPVPRRYEPSLESYNPANAVRNSPA